MKVTFNFELPDDQDEYDAARLGRQALNALWDIHQHCRSIMKHGDPTPEVHAFAEEVRKPIPLELLEA